MSRSIRRAQKAARDLDRGKLRGRTCDEVQALADFYELGARRVESVGQIDIRVFDLESDDDLFFNFEWRCRECGTQSVNQTPKIADDDSEHTCPSCSLPLGKYGNIMRLAMWLALDEVRYGKPQFARARPAV